MERTLWLVSQDTSIHDVLRCSASWPSCMILVGMFALDGKKNCAQRLRSETCDVSANFADSFN